MKLKRVFLVMMILALSLFLSACGGNSPEEVVSDFWSCLETGQLEEAENKIYAEREKEVFDVFAFIDILEEDIFQRIVTENYSFDILNVDIDGERATVGLEITLPVLEGVVDYYMNKRQKEINRYLLGEIDDTELEKKNEEILIESFQEAEYIIGREEAYLRLDGEEWKMYDWSFDTVELATEELIEEYNNPFVTEAEETVGLFWAYFKNVDFDRAKDYIYPGREEEVLAALGLIEDFEGVYPDFEEVWNERFLITTYGAEISNEERAVVDLEITTPDVEMIFDQFAEKFAEDLWDYYMDEISDSELEERMGEALIESVKETDTVSYREEAILRKYEGDWKIYDWNFDSMKAATEEWLEKMEDY